MNQFTPGPWRIARQNPSPTTGEWMISGAKPGYLAEARDCGSGDVEANARLIAAAPDLLDALYRALPFIEDCIMDDCYKPGYVGKTLDIIKTAIQKAEKP